MICQKCKSENLSKYGKNADGKQKYLCKECKGVFLENPSHKWLSDFEKDAIKQFEREGMSFRAISRELNRDYRTVYNFCMK